MIGNKKIIIFFFLFAAILFFFQTLSAQSYNKPYYQFRIFTTDNGLISNAVNCVYKDTKGFLWIGTDRGAQRFNGSSFFTFRHLNSDSNSLLNENINFIKEDRNHDIWIGTRNGIAKFSYRNGRLTNYRNGYMDGKKVNLSIVSSFLEDSQGKIWIGTIDAGLFILDRTKDQFINLPPDASLGMKSDRFKYIGPVQENDKREIVFNVIDGFVIIDAIGRQQYLQVPLPADKKTIYLPCGGAPLLKDHPNEVWITTQQNGVHKYDRVTKKWTHFPGASPGLDHAISWSDHEWMFSHYNSAYLFNHRTGVFTKFFNDRIIYGLSGIYQDNDNNIWLNSNSSGLYLLNISKQLFASTQHISGWMFDRLLNYDSSNQTLYGLNSYKPENVISVNLSTNTVNKCNIPEAFPTTTW